MNAFLIVLFLVEKVFVLVVFPGLLALQPLLAFFLLFFYAYPVGKNE
jgi:hypothetical protein